MQRSTAFVHAALLGFLVFAPACNDSAGAGKAPQPPAPVAKPEPTEAAALERSRAYWANAQKGDWIPNYEMLAPELRQRQPIGAWLQGKAHHIYEGMRPVEAITRQGERIFLRVQGRWTPDHPMARQVVLEPGQSLTQEIEIVEVWLWNGAEWQLEMPLGADEFLEKFPDLAKAVQAPASK
jgi:hypothetical protein